MRLWQPPPPGVPSLAVVVPSPTKRLVIRAPTHSSLRLGVPVLGLVAALVATLLVVPASPAAADGHLPPGGTFIDDDGLVHEGYIEAIAAAGITRGCDSDRYCPDDPVSRGEMAALLRRALRLPASSTDYFADDDGSVFEGDINAIAAHGLTSGCNEDGTRFCPAGEVTRGQMSAFLRRTEGLPAPGVDFFADDDGSIFHTDINAIAAERITAGCNPPENDAFCPRRPTTRAQMATFIGRLLDLRPIEPPPPPDSRTMGPREAIARWFGDIESQALTIAKCESSLNPDAYNPGGYYGLFQIGIVFHERAFERVTGQDFDDAIWVPYYNAQYARHLYDQTGDWRAWECRYRL